MPSYRSIYRVLASLVIFSFVFIAPLGTVNATGARSMLESQANPAVSAPGIMDLPATEPPDPPISNGNMIFGTDDGPISLDSWGPAQPIPLALAEKLQMQEQLEAAPAGEALPDPLPKALEPERSPQMENTPVQEPMNSSLPEGIQAKVEAASPEVALPEGMNIQGSLAAADGAAQAQTIIRAASASSDFYTETLTDAQGRFIFVNLPTGDYSLLARSMDGLLLPLQDTVSAKIHSREALAPQTHELSLLEEIALSPIKQTGLPPQPPKFKAEALPAETMQGTGSLSGTVTKTGGAPLSSAEVTLFTSEYVLVNQIYTDSAGTYTFTGLDAGDYVLYFFCYDFCDLAGLNGEFYNDKQTFETADRVTVADGAAVSAIDALLQGYGSISGTVSSEIDLSPMEGVYVSIENTANTYSNYTNTDSEGNYTFSFLSPDSYILYFYPYNGFVPEYFDNKSTFEEADPVTVTWEQQVTGINALLDSGPSISGMVTSETDGTPISALVTAMMMTSPYDNFFAYTNSDGSYTIPNLQPGGYRIHFRPENDCSQTDCTQTPFISEFYDGKENYVEGDIVTVADQEHVTNINATLQKGAFLYVEIKASDGSTPLQGVYIYLIDQYGSTLWLGSTGSTGINNSIAMKPGTYRLRFDTTQCTGLCSEHLSEYYDGAATLEEATPIDLVIDNPLTVSVALSTGGSITGNFTTDTGLCGAEDFPQVSLYYPESTWADRVIVPDSSGNYQFGGLSSGDYKVAFSCNGYITEWYNDKADLSSADLISVTAGQETSGISAVLSKAGGISGRVTDSASGLGLANVSVHVSNSGFFTNSWTDSSGEFNISGLPLGTYTVYFSPSDGLHIGEYYNNKFTSAEADPVNVTSPSVVSGIDAALSTGGEISGTVTSLAGGTPLEQVGVILMDIDKWWIGSQKTDSQGKYHFNGLNSGTYYIYFDTDYDCTSGCMNSNYVSEVYNDKMSLDEADAISVTTGLVTSGIDAVLVAGGGISGNMTGETGSCPTSASYAVLYNSDNVQINTTYPNESGNYYFGGLPTGIYKVYFQCEGFISEWYNNKNNFEEALQVSVTAGQDTTGINVILAAAGGISGLVTSESSGLGLSNIYVTASNGVNSHGTWTDSTGAYSFSTLPAGAYTIHFSPSDGVHTPEYYNNKPTSALADPVSVTPPAVSSGIDAALAVGGAISGTVTAEDSGLPLENIAVAIENDTFYQYGYTDAEGHYTIGGIPGGTYRVAYYTWNNSTYVFEYYDNKRISSEADLVTITPPSTLTSIDAALARGASLSGTVVSDVDGLPLVDVYVVMRLLNGDGWGTYTDAEGKYSFTGLQAGTYRLSFDTTQAENLRTLDHMREYYKDAIYEDDATLITLAAGQNAVNYDASLAIGAKITGQVTAAVGGLPVPNVRVEAYIVENGSRDYQGDTYTDEAGSYTLNGLPGGTFYVYFRPDETTDFIAESYNNKVYWQDGDLITVPEQTTVSSINASLETGRHITGTVTSASTGIPIPNWFTISIYDEDGRWREYAYNEDGEYLSPALPPGKYRLYFNPNGSTYNDAAVWLNEYYNDRPTLLTGIPITVGSSSNTAAGNVALDLAGQIRGRVTTQATGLGIGNLRVEYLNLDYRRYYYDSRNYVLTSTDGTYTIPYLEPGEYQVCFNPTNDLVQECLSGVEVTIGGHVEHVDAALEIGGRISGRITADGTFTPLPDVFVDIYSADGSYAGGATTSITGDYISSALAPGEYRLQISPSTNGTSKAYRPEYYNNQTSYAEAVPVFVTAGQTTPGIDASLALGGTITGRVTDAVTGDPVSDNVVTVNSAASQYDNSYFYYAYTDLDGYYSIQGLPVNTYKVYFYGSDLQNLMEEYYNNQQTFDTANSVYVGEAETVSSIDAALEKGGQITGRVTEAGTGTPLSGVQIYTYTPDGNYHYAVTDSDGYYSLNGLPTGSYELEVSKYLYAKTMVGGFEHPTPVSVTAGAVTPGIDVEMVRGAVIAGWVTGADSGKNEWAWVSAYNSSGHEVYGSNAAYPKGLFELILAPGQDYRISFSPNYSDQPYITTFYANKSSLALADPISLATGDVLYPINGVMALGGQISGLVTDESAQPLPDVLVLIYDASDEIVSACLTDADGIFLCSGLAAGNYRLMFDPSYSGLLSGYLSEFYNNKGSLAEADLVAVVPGETTSGINAQLAVSVVPIAAFEIGTQTVGEAAGSVSVSLTLDKPGAELITIPFTVAGTATGGGVDHTLALGTFQFPAGETLDTIAFNIVDDATHEADETVVITLGSPTNAALGSTTTHTVTIQDNDALPQVSFANPSQTVSEAVGTVSVAVNLNTSYPETVSVPYSVSGYAAGGGIDHTLQNGVLAFNPDQTNKTISFSVANDTIDEMDESIVITLSEPVNAQLGANTFHTITIQDDDEPVIVLPAPTVTQVTPSQGWSHIPTEIVIYGTNFSAGAVATLKLNLQSSALSTTFIAETQLLALVPGGLAEGLYSIEVSNPDGKKGSLSGAYKVMPRLTDDLFANSYDIWTDPGTVYAGESYAVGLNVQRQGGQTALPSVKVDIYLGDPAADGTKLASVFASDLAPGGWVSTTGFSWTAPAAGSYTLVAVIDPENSVNETNETNNQIIRQITVQNEPVPLADLTPPTISSFVVNQGKPNSASPTITYTTSAVDNTGGSGLNKTMIIEYAFFEGVNQWIQVKSSDWLPYQENIDQTYPLVETAGSRYLQIWAADNAGNVSTEPKTAFINYIPTNDTLVKGQSRYYIFNLTQGQEFNATVTPTQGDPDLYVWAPDFYARDAWMSLASEGPDTVVFSSPLAGMYVVQIYSYTNSGFQFTAGGIPLSKLNSLSFTATLDLSKEPVAEPGLEPGNVPSEQRAIPEAPQGEVPPPQFQVFIPLIKK